METEELKPCKNCGQMVPPGLWRAIEHSKECAAYIIVPATFSVDGWNNLAHELINAPAPPTKLQQFEFATLADGSWRYYADKKDSVPIFTPPPNRADRRKASRKNK